MIVIIISFGVGSIALGLLLGRILKHAAEVGTVELPIEGSAQEHHGDVTPASPTHSRAQLIPKSHHI